MSTAVRFLILGSLRGGILILAVLLLRVLLRKLPKRYVCLLWTAVWLRLALPFAVRSRFGLLPGLSFLDRSGAARSQSAAVPILSPEAATSSAPTTAAFVSRADLPLLIWAVGLTSLLLFAGIRYLLLKRRLREAIPYRGKLWLCDWVETPFLLGLFRPRIYLPSGVEEADVPWIAAHEEAHLRHGDPWRKLGAFLLTAVYWFQPLGFGSAPVRKRIEAILHPSGCGCGKLAMAALLCAVVLLTLTVEPVQAARTAPEAGQPLSESTLEAELPPSETTSALPDTEQPEADEPAHSETIGWEIGTDKDGTETKWFLVASPSGDASVLLHPDGYSEVLYGEAYIMLYDEESGQTYAIGPVSPGGDAP